jgi:hypothetical protein
MTSPIPQQAMPVPAALEDAGLAQNIRPVEKLSTPPAIPAGSGFYLQFGAFAIRSNAENVMSQLKGKAEPFYQRLKSCNRAVYTAWSVAPSPVAQKRSKRWQWRVIWEPESRWWYSAE